MKKLTTILAGLAAVAALSFAPTLAGEEENDLKLFRGFQEDCSGACPVNAGPGECCAELPPFP